MKIILFIALFFISAIFTPNLVFGQEIPKDSTKLHVVRTNDDNEYIGYIVSWAGETIMLKTENLGTINIQKKNIKSIVPIEKSQIVQGEYWFENPHTTRYFFQPNAYGLRRGEGYYQNTWIFFNQVSYGVSNNFTIGAGMIPIFLFGGAASPFWITPRVTVPIVKDKFNISTGAFIGTVLGEDTDGPFGIAYGNASVGSRDRNLTVGIGYGFAGGEWSDTPALSLSGMVRVSKKFAFMIENFFIDAGDETAALSFVGGRFIGKKIAVDAALVIPVSELEDTFVAIPWLGLNVPFGSRN